jgi:hypothetical protein
MDRRSRMIDAVLRVQSQLTDRDFVLLDWLVEHGVLTSFQIAEALFPSLDYAQERLRKLVALRVLERFRPNRLSGGSFPYHYLLAQLGLEVISVQRGEELQRRDRDRARRRRWQFTNRANLPHLVGVNGFFTSLAGYARSHDDCSLERWWSAGRCQQAGAFTAASADVFKRLYTPKSRPDGHGIWVQEGWRAPFFLEYDTGTERPISRLGDKIDGYAELAQRIGRTWPVLFWLPGLDRERRLHQHLTEADVRYPVATAVHDGGNPAEAVWWLHRQRGPRLDLAELGYEDVSASEADSDDDMEGRARRGDG